MTEFVVPGKAEPGGSKRAVVRGGHAIVIDANPNVGAWKERVAIVASQVRGQSAPVSGPVELTVRIRFLRPQSHYTKTGRLTKGAPMHHTTVPDTTKCVRAIEDALNGVYWEDDRQVVVQHASKEYADRDEVIISIKRMPGGNSIDSGAGSQADVDPSSSSRAAGATHLPGIANSVEAGARLSTPEPTTSTPSGKE